MKLPIQPEALIELDEAMAFYEDERPGLGLELLDAIEETVAFAAEVPAGGERRGHELDAYETRRFVVKRFPYLVYVARIHHRRVVVAIAHASRRPGYCRIGPADPACDFRCGKHPLDDYFRRHAVPNDQGNIGLANVVEASAEDLDAGLPAVVGF